MRRPACLARLGGTYHRLHSPSHAGWLVLEDDVHVHWNRHDHRVTVRWDSDEGTVSVQGSADDVRDLVRRVRWAVAALR